MSKEVFKFGERKKGKESEKKKEEPEINPQYIQKFDNARKALSKVKPGGMLKVLPANLCDDCPMGKTLMGEGYLCREWKEGAICAYDSKFNDLVGQYRDDPDKAKIILDDMIEMETHRYLQSVALDKMQRVVTPLTEKIAKTLSDLIDKRRQFDNPSQFVSQEYKHQEVNFYGNNQDSFPPELMRRLLKEVAKKPPKKVDYINEV